MNKKFTKILCALVLSAMVISGCAKAPKDALVKIGDVYITEEQIKAESGKIISSMTEEEKKNYDESTEEGKAQLNALNQRILDNFTNAEIIKQKMESIYNKAKKDGKGEDELKEYQVTDEEINEQLKLIKEQIGGEEKFKEELEKYKITEAELKTQIKNQELNKKFELWFNKTYEPTKEEITAKYAGSAFEGPEIEASHILVETEEEAIKVKERLDNGEKLEDIAKDVSKDPSAQVNNGKLGKFTKGVMVPEFYDAASKLKSGEISAPVKSQYGYHIIKVDAIESDFNNFSEETKTNLESRLKNTILQERFTKEFEEIKKELGVMPIKNFK